MNVTIEFNAFNSGVLAPRVGMVSLEPAEDTPPSLGAHITRLARAQGYQLVTINSPRPVELEDCLFVGSLTLYRGSIDEMRRRADVGRRSTAIRIGPAASLAPVEQLLAHAQPTRFSADPKLPAAVVVRHKLKSIDHYRASQPQHCLLAESPDGPAGFQSSHAENGTFVLYEIIVHPLFRRGFLAIELLARNLEALRAWAPGIDRVETKIYEHNVQSRRFFTALGLSPGGQTEYHYHLWT